MIKTKRIIEIYSDGSGNSLDSDGGWGCVIVVDGTKVDERCGFMLSATNNTAELTAAINGFKAAYEYVNSQGWIADNCHFTLISDSQLVLNYAKNTWKCKKDHLRPLCNTLQTQYNFYDADTRWVKGHNGDEHNERCDELAGHARKSGRKRKIGQKFLSTLIKFELIKDELELSIMYDTIKKLAPVPY